MLKNINKKYSLELYNEIFKCNKKKIKKTEIEKALEGLVSIETLALYKYKTRVYKERQKINYRRKLLMILIQHYKYKNLVKIIEENTNLRTINNIEVNLLRFFMVYAHNLIIKNEKEYEKSFFMTRGVNEYILCFGSNLFLHLEDYGHNIASGVYEDIIKKREVYKEYKEKEEKEENKKKLKLLENRLHYFLVKEVEKYLIG